MRTSEIKKIQRGRGRGRGFREDSERKEKVD